MKPTFEQVQQALGAYDGPSVKIMEVCGTHTAAIFRNGIRSILSPKIQLISGPGCPVCVTSAAYIDKLVEYSLKPSTCVLTFGDMMKVKGKSLSLTGAKAQGGNARVIYSPLGALELVEQNPQTQFIMAAVGFETTTPIYALMIEQMLQRNIANLKLLTSLKTIFPALELICETEKDIDAFLCPGHVSVMTGWEAYKPLAEWYHKPFVVGGFEGEHILAAVYDIIDQLQKGQGVAKNCYPSAVSNEGNQRAAQLVSKYFEPADEFWRGIGNINNSGLKLRREYMAFDAGSSFDSQEEVVPKGCRCTDVILGRIHPGDCPLFGTVCTPFQAVGPCMVSGEGACGIWYQNRQGNSITQPKAVSERNDERI